MAAVFDSDCDVICLSHLRWDFVYQRPQHLLGRCARERRVFFVEEPRDDRRGTWMHFGNRPEGVWVVMPHLTPGMDSDGANATQKRLLDDFLAAWNITNYVLWYYTPMALDFTRHLTPRAVVYDCMDELSAFADAPPALREREGELLQKADLVFTGGPSLYEAKKDRHPRVFAFPSSIEAAHFAKARVSQADPADQSSIPHPRLGFYGVVDERFDLDLMNGVAKLRPDWHWVIVGPVVKIDEKSLPKRPNIHYLGGKSYEELPAYLSGWDVATLPFARNDSTRFISPTKTPEYLAAGKPVVSTSIRDVVRPYGKMALVHIADKPNEFVAAVERALAEPGEARQAQADAFLAQTSWDKSWKGMADLIDGAVKENAQKPLTPTVKAES